MPGYDVPVIMAAGTFIQGSSIEFSADGPIKPPYNAYMQGGLVAEQIYLAAMTAIDKMGDQSL
jgi:cystathionine beta-lyase family protein involved in aluminum resistance